MSIPVIRALFRALRLCVVAWIASLFLMAGSPLPAPMTGDPTSAVVTHAKCLHDVTQIMGPPEGTNVSAELDRKPDGSVSVWSMQYICDDRVIKVTPITHLGFSFNPHTRLLKIHWGSDRPIRWLGVMVRSHSGVTSYVPVGGSQTHYEAQLPEGEELYGISVAGHDPSLPPPVPGGDGSGILIGEPEVPAVPA